MWNISYLKDWLHYHIDKKRIDQESLSIDKLTFKEDSFHCEYQTSCSKKHFQLPLCKIEHLLSMYRLSDEDRIKLSVYHAYNQTYLRYFKEKPDLIRQTYIQFALDDAKRAITIK